SNTTTPQPVHPPFAIFMSGEHMEVNIASAATGSTVETDTTLYLDPNPIQRGHYYAITIEANFQNNANGFLEVWRDGTEIVNYHGAIGYGQSVYWKEGIYRSPTTVVMAADYQNTTVTDTSSNLPQLSGIITIASQTTYKAMYGIDASWSELNTLLQF